MRQCPFAGCKAEVPHNLFACRKHWFMLNQKQRNTIHAAYADYCEHKIGLEALRMVQRAIIDDVQQPSKAKGTPMSQPAENEGDYIPDSSKNR